GHHRFVKKKRGRRKRGTRRDGAGARRRSSGRRAGGAQRSVPPLAEPWTGRLSIEYVRCRPSRVFGFTAATSSRCGLWTPPALRCALGGPDARCVRAVGCHGGGGDGLAAG